MCIRDSTYIETIDGEMTPINHAYFTMVGLGPDDKPVPVPRLELETDEDREEWEKAKMRKELKIRRKEEGI